MSNVIIKVSESKMNEMKAAYQANLLQKKIPYTNFSAKKKWDNNHCLYIWKSHVSRCQC